MSIDATRWAWQQDLRPTVKLVLLSLADRAGNEHSCWPCYEQLVADTGLDRKTVWQAIKLLRDRGMIEDTGERKGATRQVPVFRLIGVEGREKRNSSKNGTVPVLVGNSSENGTGNSSENGIRNLPVEPTRTIKRGGRRFTPPTLPELTAFISAERLNVNPTTFITHYQSKGWTVGKSPMKDWRAAARGWSHREETKHAADRLGRDPAEDRSAAGRVRAAVARSRAERAGQGPDRDLVAVDGLAVRPQVG